MFDVVSTYINVWSGIMSEPNITHFATGSYTEVREKSQ